MTAISLPTLFLEELRSRTSMHALVSRTVKLTRSGRNWKGCCPFHHETSSSFYIYEDGFHCFGCGAHGDAIKFVVLTQKISEELAASELAAEAGLALPKQKQEGEARRQSMSNSTTFKNESTLPDDTIDAVLSTAARLLVTKNQVRSASILANASGNLTHWSHDNWNGGQETWRLSLAVPSSVFLDIDGREDREQEIAAALDTAMKAVSDSDFFTVDIVTALHCDPEWRRKVNQHLGGGSISNQGRVRSDNIAAIEQDGLRFRSWPEVHFYQAMKSTGVPFAPLSVVLHGGLGAKARRVEPDFIIYKDGMTLAVEIDGDVFHAGSAATEHARLKFLTDEGVKVERINANECNTVEKAREAVDRILATINKLRRNKQ